MSDFPTFVKPCDRIRIRIGIKTMPINNTDLHGNGALTDGLPLLPLLVTEVPEAEASRLESNQQL
jgi:hypothetical protein